MNNKQEMNQSVSTPMEYRGETLEELRMRRAMVAVKLDFQKEALQSRAQQVIGEHSGKGSVLGAVLGTTTSKFPLVGYVLTGLKVARVAFNIIRLFRRKR
ncbi:MAG: hypothetical protein ACI4UN_01155 [Muribaculaceae bacterium]